MTDNILFIYGLTEREKDEIYADLDRADEQDSIRREQEELEHEIVWQTKWGKQNEYK